MEVSLKTFDLVTLDLWMIAVFAVLFFFFWRAMEGVVFKPFMNLVDKREDLTEGALEKAKAIAVEADELNARYETRLTEARVAAMEKKLKAVSVVEAEAKDLIDKANSEAQEYLRNLRWDAKRNFDEIRGRVLSGADQMAKEVSDRILGTARGGSLLSVMLLLSVLMLVVGYCVPAFAAGSAGHHGGSIGDLLWPAVNFVIYLLVWRHIFKKLGPTIGGVWDGRRESLEQRITAGEKAVSDANTAVHKAQTNISRMEEDVKKLFADIESQTRKECKVMLGAARKKSEAILGQARRLGEAEKKAVEDALQDELAKTVIEKARAKISAELDSEKDKALRMKGLVGVNQLI